MNEEKDVPITLGEKYMLTIREASIYFNITYTSKDTITEVYASENGTSYKKCTYESGKYRCYTSKRYCSGETINDIKIYIKNSKGTTSDVYTISTYTVSS